MDSIRRNGERQDLAFFRRSVEVGRIRDGIVADLSRARGARQCLLQVRIAHVLVQHVTRRSVAVNIGIRRKGLAILAVIAAAIRARNHCHIRRQRLAIHEVAKKAARERRGCRRAVIDLVILQRIEGQHTLQDRTLAHSCGQRAAILLIVDGKHGHFLALRIVDLCHEIVIAHALERVDDLLARAGMLIRIGSRARVDDLRLISREHALEVQQLLARALAAISIEHLRIAVVGLGDRRIDEFGRNGQRIDTALRRARKHAIRQLRDKVKITILVLDAKRIRDILQLPLMAVLRGIMCLILYHLRVILQQHFTVCIIVLAIAIEVDEGLPLDMGRRIVHLIRLVVRLRDLRIERNHVLLIGNHVRRDIALAVCGAILERIALGIDQAVVPGNRIILERDARIGDVLVITHGSIREIALDGRHQADIIAALTTGMIEIRIVGNLLGAVLFQIQPIHRGLAGNSRRAIIPLCLIAKFQHKVTRRNRAHARKRGLRLPLLVRIDDVVAGMIALERCRIEYRLLCRLSARVDDILARVMRVDRVRIERRVIARDQSLEGNLAIRILRIPRAIVGLADIFFRIRELREHRLLVDGTLMLLRQRPRLIVIRFDLAEIIVVGDVIGKLDLVGHLARAGVLAVVDRTLDIVIIRRALRLAMRKRDPAERDAVEVIIGRLAARIGAPYLGIRMVVGHLIAVVVGLADGSEVRLNVRIGEVFARDLTFVVGHRIDFRIARSKGIVRPLGALLARRMVQRILQAHELHGLRQLIAIDITIGSKAALFAVIRAIGALNPAVVEREVLAILQAVEIDLLRHIIDTLDVNVRRAVIGTRKGTVGDVQREFPRVDEAAQVIDERVIRQGRVCNGAFIRIVPVERIVAALAIAADTKRIVDALLDHVAIFISCHIGRCIGRVQRELRFVAIVDIVSRDLVGQVDDLARFIRDVEVHLTREVAFDLRRAIVRLGDRILLRRVDSHIELARRNRAPGRICLAFILTQQIAIHLEVDEGFWLYGIQGIGHPGIRDDVFLPIIEGSTSRMADGYSFLIARCPFPDLDMEVFLCLGRRERSLVIVLFRYMVQIVIDIAFLERQTRNRALVVGHGEERRILQRIVARTRPVARGLCPVEGQSGKPDRLRLLCLCAVGGVDIAIRHKIRFGAVIGAILTLDAAEIEGNALAAHQAADRNIIVIDNTGCYCLLRVILAIERVVLDLQAQGFRRNRARAFQRIILLAILVDDIVILMVARQLYRVVDPVLMHVAIVVRPGGTITLDVLALIVCRAVLRIDRNLADIAGNQARKGNLAARIQCIRVVHQDILLAIVDLGDGAVRRRLGKRRRNLLRRNRTRRMALDGAIDIDIGGEAREVEVIELIALQRQGIVHPLADRILRSVRRTADGVVFPQLEPGTIDGQGLEVVFRLSRARLRTPQSLVRVVIGNAVRGIIDLRNARIEYDRDVVVRQLVRVDRIAIHRDGVDAVALVIRRIAGIREIVVICLGTAQREGIRHLMRLIASIRRIE